MNYFIFERMDFTNFLKVKITIISLLQFIRLDRIAFSYYHFFFGHVFSKTLQSTFKKLSDLTRDFLVVTSDSEIKILWFVLLGFFFVHNIHMNNTHCIFIHIFVKSNTHVFLVQLDTLILHNAFIFKLWLSRAHMFFV